MELMMFCPFIAFFILFFILVLAIIAYGVQRIRMQTGRWQVFASRSGLVFEPGSFGKGNRISGIYCGHQVLLDTFSHHTGYSSSHSYPYTRVTVILDKGADIDLKIEEKHLLHFNKGNTIKTGDEQIDQRFSFSGRSSNITRNIFVDANLCQRIIQVRSFNIEISNQHLTFTQPGIEKDIVYLTYLLDLLCDLASFVEQMENKKI